jgi:hypothetical protein
MAGALEAGRGAEVAAGWLVGDGWAGGLMGRVSKMLSGSVCHFLKISRINDRM